jgi:GTPase SAR1 family protein
MHHNKTSGLPLIRGKVAKPQRVVIYGPEGIGKTTLAAAFPEPVFLDTEGGTVHLNVTRFAQPQTWDDVLSLVAQLGQSEHTFKTLVVDTADWLERLLIEHICRKARKDGIEDFGYGQGYTYLAEEFSRFLQSLEALRSRGMHLVMVAHSTIRKFEQPDAVGAYDRYELKLSKKCAPLLKEWCDLLLFVNYFTKVTEKDGRAKAVGGKERRIHTSHTASYDAKNRHEIGRASCRERV